MPEVVAVWSDKAKKTYNNIIEYLSSNWTAKEIHHFIFRTDTVIEKIIENPYLFQQFKKDPLTRKAVLHETVILIYRVSTDVKIINLITFWGTRQNPKKIRLSKS